MAKQRGLWQSLVSEAEKLGKTTLARKIRGFDLCSVEAKHHTSCHRTFKTEYHNFIRVEKRAVARSTDTERALITAAHSDASRSVLQYIQETIIKENKIVQLYSLRLIYIDTLTKHGYPNDQYCSVNLMNRLQSHPDISPRIVFCKVYSGDIGCLSFYLVYSSNRTVAEAIACA